MKLVIVEADGFADLSASFVWNHKPIIVKEQNHAKKPKYYNI